MQKRMHNRGAGLEESRGSRDPAPIGEDTAWICDFRSKLSYSVLNGSCEGMFGIELKPPRRLRKQDGRRSRQTLEAVGHDQNALRCHEIGFQRSPAMHISTSRTAID